MSIKSMNNKKVIIIDSGIDISNTNFNKCIIGGIGFKYNSNGLIIKENNYNDENGHGTYCASIIQDISPNTSMFIVKILNREAKTNSRILIEALKYIKDINIRVVNLSIATTNKYCEDELNDICYELYKKGKIIICSLDNRNDISFPAVFEHVIGVSSRKMANLNDYWYNDKKKIQCVADGSPEFVPTLNNKFGIFGGNSKSTAKFTAMVLNILDKNNNVSFDRLRQVVECHAIKNDWTQEEVSKDIDLEYEEITDLRNNYLKDQLIELEKIFIKILNLSKEDVALLYKYKLPNYKIRYKREDFYYIIKEVEKRFNININYRLLSFNIFESIYCLLDFINMRANSNEK